MENIVLTIGGFIKSLTWTDLFFFCAILILILLLIYIVYLVRLDDDDSLEKDILKVMDEESKPESHSIEEIVSNLEENYEPKPIDLSQYEKEMEDTAIISYDELKKRTSNDIVYDDDYDSGIDDVLVRRVDANSSGNTKEYVDLPKAIMMSYDNEEAFLKALKKLKSNLVR